MSAHNSRDMYGDIVQVREKQQRLRKRWKGLSLADKANEIKEGWGLTHGGSQQNKKKRKPRKRRNKK